MRAQLSPHAIWLIKAGRNTFLVTQAVPLILYYLRFSDKTPKFPATISHTIRKGPPRWFHHVSWSLGWVLTVLGMWPHANRAVRLFMIQMVLTGIVCVMLFPLGEGGPLGLKIHYVTATIYMADHYWLAKIFNERSIYRVGFNVCFVVMVLAAILSKRIEKIRDVDSNDEDQDKDDNTKAIETYNFAKRMSRRLSLVCVGGAKALLYPIETNDSNEREDAIELLSWFLKLLVMVTENGVFASFVLGMASGLRSPGQLLVKH